MSATVHIISELRAREGGDPATFVFRATAKSLGSRLRGNDELIFVHGEAI